MKVELTIGDLNLRLPIRELIDLIRKAEDQGFDGIGLPDLVRFGTDVFSLFAAAAAETSRITMFPNVSNPITRHPWVLANTCATLGQLTQGRFRLTIGAGTPLNLGRPPARVAEMRTAVSTICGLLAGKDVPLVADPASAAAKQTGDMNYFDRAHLTGLIDRPEYPAPVCMAVGGPRMMELAGEVADEAMILTGQDPRAVALARGLLETGAKRAGRTLDTFKIAHWAFVYIDDDEDAAYEHLIRESKRYPFGTHLNQLSLDALGLSWDPNNLDQVPDSEWRQFLDATAFVGPAEKIAEQFQEVARRGELDRIVCGVSGPNRDVALSQFSHKVIAKLK